MLYWHGSTGDKISEFCGWIGGGGKCYSSHYKDNHGIYIHPHQIVFKGPDIRKWKLSIDDVTPVDEDIIPGLTNVTILNERAYFGGRPGECDCWLTILKSIESGERSRNCNRNIRV